MIPLYKNDYIKILGTAENFKLEIDQLPSTFNNLYAESCRAAEELYALKEGKIHILYSGGIDSEYCLSVFLSLGIEVVPVIIKLNPGYNDHDTQFAFDFCESRNITPKIIDIDFDKFVSSGKIFDICKEMTSSTFGRASVGYAAGLLDGTVILGDGEPYVRLDTNDNNWYLEELEHDFATYRYFQKHGIHGTTHFNRWTAGMMAAYMCDSRVAELANNQHPGKLSTNTSRPIIYNRYTNFNLKVRPKFHGFEKLGDLANSSVLQQIEEFGKSCNGHWRIKYQDFIADYIHV
jgi:hypothetical protein